MTIESLLAWWNIIFVLPFLLALLYLLVYAASGLTFGDSDAEGDFGPHSDFDTDADAHLDADAGAHANLHADADAHMDVDTDAHLDAPVAPGGAAPDVDAHPTLQAAALSWLGLGRVPLSILMMVLLLTWGAAGFVMNQIARGWVREEWQVAFISLPFAAALALLVTRVVVRSIDRWLPLNETTAGRRHDLLGAAGVAIYPITERFGMVSVRDVSGDLYQVPCRMEPGRAAVPKGAAVVLTGYSARTKAFYVVPSDAVGAPDNNAAGIAGASGPTDAPAETPPRQATERGR